MDVVSLCPLRVASVVWQPRLGGSSLTVVCKATYVLTPVEAQLARDQEYPNEDDNYWDDDPARSLCSPSDMVPFKPRADVLLVGHAFAPNKEPVRSLLARLCVAEVDKTIEVSCDRVWAQDGSLREGPRFMKMPLRYERAAGGLETSNPVGIRCDAQPDAFGSVPLPNLTQPGVHPSQRGEFLAPVSFGPIAPTWPSRSEKLGRHASIFQHRGWPSQPLPQDIDPGYFNAAPRDQQVEVLRPDERLVLENLLLEHPRMVTNLPGHKPRAFIERPGVAPQELSLTCDTLWIDTDRALCTLTWRGQVALTGPRQPGRVLVAMEEPGQRMGWAEVERLAGPPRDVGEVGAGLRSEERPFDPMLDTVGPSEQAPGSMANSLPFAAAPGPFSPRTMPIGYEEVTGTGIAIPGAALPFDPKGTQSLPRVDPVKARGDASPPWLAAARPPRRPSGAPPGPPPMSPFAPRAPSTPGFPAAMAPPAAPPHVAPPPVTPVPPAPPAPPPLVAPSAPQMPLAPPSVESPWAASAAKGGPSLSSPPLSSPSLSPPLSSPSLSPSLSPPLPSPSSPSLPMSPSPSSSPSLSSPSPSSPNLTPGLRSAVQGGAAAASTAAAGAWGASAAASAPAPAPAPAASPSAPRAPMRPTGREVVDLLWFESKAVERMRAKPAWKDLLAELAPKPPLSVDFDDDLPPPPPPEERDHRDVVGLLTRGDPVGAEGIEDAVEEAVSDEGLFSPPLVLVAGELHFPFDELETLKATVTAVTPLIAGDKKLRETVDTVNELLKTPWLGSSSGVAEGLTTRVKESFAQGNRMLPPSYLETHTERVLLEQRHYQRRTVFGEKVIRSLFVAQGASSPVPAYLPESLANRLPMFQRFRARLVAEAQLQQDESEASAVALRVVALGRVVVLAGRRR